MNRCSSSESSMADSSRGGRARTAKTLVPAEEEEGDKKKRRAERDRGEAGVYVAAVDPIHERLGFGFETGPVLPGPTRPRSSLAKK